MQKTFLLQVGCQKGGTTWLHNYLAQSKEADFGMLKEYHVFDALDLPFCGKFVPASKHGHPLPSNVEELKLRESLIGSLDNYVEYFCGLLKKSPVIKLTGDMTPAYAALSTERFADIRSEFRLHSVDVRVIFIIRDPVERLWSSVRMRQRERAKNKPSARQLNKSDDHLLSKAYRQTGNAARTNYHHTILNLEQVFDCKNLLYVFYEELFESASAIRICSFLGIELVTPKFDEKINPSPKSSQQTLPVDTIQSIVEYYEEVYRFVEYRFGRDKVLSLWDSAKYIL